ncbi:unnamed protein product [Tuber aestivum]|uniref:Uncharacterized protein n=1 Tax=Tuber aestivum TaxID=59557 RepID=A0A292Q1U5_9PEZI|nr:unnamed protein product [Tuber aestivum]
MIPLRCGRVPGTYNERNGMIRVQYSTSYNHQRQSKVKNSRDIVKSRGTVQCHTITASASHAFSYICMLHTFFPLAMVLGQRAQVRTPALIFLVVGANSGLEVVWTGYDTVAQCCARCWYDLFFSFSWYSARPP